MQVEGVWLPKHEKHLLEWMTASKGAHRENGLITYQWAKQRAACAAAHELIPNWREKLFVDVGAHVGLWSMWWIKEMARVVAFEPIPDMAALFVQNVTGDYILHEKALGAESGTLTLAFNPENTGNTHKAHGGDKGLTMFDVPLTTLDTELYSLGSPPVGVMKVDCEGTELAVLQGGKEIIARDRPLIVVEQKKGAEYYGYDPTGAVKHLKDEHGYRVLKVMSGDYIMAPA